MVIVAIDTSQSIGSVALARDGDVAGSARFGENASHLADIGHSVDALLAGERLAIRDVDRLALVIGPGSFTGLRVGLAYVKGLHAACGTGLVVIDTLELLALPHLAGHARVCPMIDARRGETYGAVFGINVAPNGATPCASATALVAPAAKRPDVFIQSLTTEPDLFLGSGARLYEKKVRERFPDATIADETNDYPSTEYLARIADRLTPLPPADVRALEPNYLRDSEAQRKKLRPIDP